MNFSEDKRPIGVFDSGVGGLTVLKSLMTALPGERFVYLGDTARVPYGTKSAETVCAYSTGLARILLQHDVKMIIIACNTASVHAAEAVTAMAAPIPVISMIPPAAEAALRATRNGHIMVMATQSTIRSNHYAEALRQRRPDLQVTSVPAQILVALAEEGWTDGSEAQAVIERYIGAITARTDAPDTIILGCTHFPLLKDTIAQIAGPDITLIDSGHAAAKFIMKTYTSSVKTTENAGTTRFLVTDSPERFHATAERFLGQPIQLDAITHVDLTDTPLQTSPLLKKGNAHV